MRHALITGGGGFIGHYLTAHLMKLGVDVTALDNFSTGQPENVEPFRRGRGYRFVKGDVQDRDLLHVLMSQCDVVYHLAAAVGVQLVVDKPVHTIQTNIHGTETVLEIAHKFSRPVFIASTSEVYGKSNLIPFREDDDVTLGATKVSRWGYACSKMADEFLALAYHREFQLPVVIGRFFNTVGPRQTGKYGMVIPRFVEAALDNRPITLYGTGLQSRCFTHVEDVVVALPRLMAAPEAHGRVFNIGSANEVSIQGLAERIIKLTGSTSAIETIPYEQAYGREFDDMLRRVPCLDRIHQTIGYRPAHTLDSILVSVIDYHKGRREEGRAA